MVIAIIDDILQLMKNVESIELQVHNLLPGQAAVVPMEDPNNKHGEYVSHILFNDLDGRCHSYPPLPKLGGMFESPKNGVFLGYKQPVADIHGSETGVVMSGFANIIKPDSSGAFPGSGKGITIRDGKIIIADGSDDTTKKVTWIDNDGNIASEHELDVNFVNLLSSLNPRYTTKHWGMLVAAATSTVSLALLITAQRRRNTSE